MSKHSDAKCVTSFALATNVLRKSCGCSSDNEDSDSTEGSAKTVEEGKPEVIEKSIGYGQPCIYANTRMGTVGYPQIGQSGGRNTFIKDQFYAPTGFLVDSSSTAKKIGGPRS